MNFLELLEKPGKVERFSKILNGTQFSSKIINHIVKGFDLKSMTVHINQIISRDIV
jgi:hypothetical protein